MLRRLAGDLSGARARVSQRRLVEGAVGMVELALIDINEKGLADFTQEQRVALVTNLMTVLVGDEKAQPVLQVARAK